MKKTSKRSDKISSFAEYITKFFPKSKQSEAGYDDPYRFGQSLAEQALAKNKHLLSAK